MDDPPMKWMRSPSSDGMLALFAVTTIAGGGIGWFTLQDADFDQLAKMRPDDGGKLFAVSIPIAMFLAGGALLLWAVCNRVAGVALEIDEDGLTDHRGVGRILWSEVQSFDAEVFTINGSPRSAKLILYVGGAPGQLRTVEVEVGGLDNDPMEIVRRAKLAWMNVASRAGSPAEPGAAADGGAR